VQRPEQRCLLRTQWRLFIATLTLLRTHHCCVMYSVLWTNCLPNACQMSSFYPTCSAYSYLARISTYFVLLQKYRNLRHSINCVKEIKMPYARKKRSTGRKYPKRSRKPVKAVILKSRPKKARMVSRTFAMVTKPIRIAHFTSQYTFNMSLSSVLNSNSQVFRANSIYDPDFSNVSKNTVVNGYTTAALYYQQYCVLNCKCSVTVWNMSSTTCVEAVCTASDQNTFSSTLRATDIATRPNAKSIVLGPMGSNKSSHTFFMFVNIARLLGIPQKMYTDDIFYNTNFGLNPTMPVYVSITGSALPEGSGSVAQLLIRYKFDMLTRLGNPIEDVNDD